MKIVALLLFIFSIPASSFASSTVYNKKSISSGSTVWIKDQASYSTQDLKLSFATEAIKYYIEMPRFDYNVLPDTLFNSVFETASAQGTLDSEGIATIFEEQLAPEILRLLNDPDIQKQRFKALKKSKQKVTLAETKGKSLSLTANDLKTLLNSAYIYLPYISSVTNHRSDNGITVKIEGGLLWYHLAVDETGAATIRSIAKLESVGEGDAPFENKKNSDYEFDTFVFNGKSRTYNKAQIAHAQALASWAKNLGVLTRDLKEFKLRGTIVEAIGAEYKIDVGRTHGIRLDDGYYLMGYEEINGVEVKKNYGYLSVIDVQKNHSYLTQRLGNHQGVGGWVAELPRLGLEFSIKATGQLYSIDPQSFLIPGKTGTPLQRSLRRWLGGNIIFNKNVAETTKESQLYFSSWLSGYTTVPTLSPGASALPLMVSFYGGVLKKYWSGSNNLHLGLFFGVDRFYLGGYSENKAYKFDIDTIGMKLLVGIEKMLTPDIQFNVAAAYKQKLFFSTIDVKIDHLHHDLSEQEKNNIQERFNPSGLSLSFGFNIALRTLWFDPFTGLFDTIKTNVF